MIFHDIFHDIPCICTSISNSLFFQTSKSPNPIILRLAGEVRTQNPLKFRPGAQLPQLPQLVLRDQPIRPWSSGLEDEFPLKIGEFQGRTVYLPEGNTNQWLDGNC